MLARVILLSAALPLCACGQGNSGRVVQCADAPALPDAPDYLVRGTLAQRRGVPQTYDQPFVVTAQSHATIELYYTASEDGVSETLAKQCIVDLPGLPLSFRVPGSPGAVYGRGGVYGLVARIYSGAGDDLYVGDLSNEGRIAVSAASRDLALELTGAERCGAPGGGGFCSDLAR